MCNRTLVGNLSCIYVLRVQCSIAQGVDKILQTKKMNRPSVHEKVACISG